MYSFCLYARLAVIFVGSSRTRKHNQVIQFVKNDLLLFWRLIISMEHQTQQKTWRYWFWSTPGSPQNPPWKETTWDTWERIINSTISCICFRNETCFFPMVGGIFCAPPQQRELFVTPHGHRLTIGNMFVVCTENALFNQSKWKTRKDKRHCERVLNTRWCFQRFFLNFPAPKT